MFNIDIYLKIIDKKLVKFNQKQYKLIARIFFVLLKIWNFFFEAPYYVKHWEADWQ